jgi:hypothetical protein
VDEAAVLEGVLDTRTERFFDKKYNLNKVYVDNELEKMDIDVSDIKAEKKTKVMKRLNK